MFFLLHILNIDDNKRTVKIKMQFGIHWNEPRLIFPNDSNVINTYPLDLRFLSYLWVPDIEIYNLEQLQTFSVLRKIAGMVIHIYELGLLRADAEAV